MKRYAIFLCVFLTLFSGVVVAVAALPASAQAASHRPQEYLALGDSVACGFNPVARQCDANIKSYPDKVAPLLKENLTNASCPGETSSHFIDLTGSDNGCGVYRQFFPLPYTTSQLDYVDTFLQSHRQTLVITIDIGANDLFVTQRTCGLTQACLGAMLATLSANLDTIYGHIRNLDDYHHKIVALTYYLTNYNDPLATLVISALNNVVAARTLAWGGIVADGFGAFKAASAAFGGDSCAAGLLFVLQTSPLTCDIHPSQAGHDLLAQTIVDTLR